MRDIVERIRSIDPKDLSRGARFGARSRAPIGRARALLGVARDKMFRPTGRGKANHMPLEDKQLRRRAEREIAKFPLDVSRLMIRCAGDTIFLEGRIRLERSGEAKTADLDKTLRAAEETLRSLPKVRDVVVAGLQKDYN